MMKFEPASFWENLGWGRRYNILKHLVKKLGAFCFIVYQIVLHRLFDRYRNAPLFRIKQKKFGHYQVKTVEPKDSFLQVFFLMLTLVVI